MSRESDCLAAGISLRAKSAQFSPIRKLAYLAEERKSKGIKVYHLNIGQPDLQTSPAVFEAIRNLKLKTLSYAPSNGLPECVAAWKNYLGSSGIKVNESEIIVTSGGSEAIIFAMCAVCDPGDEVIVFEPFYTNYNGFAGIAGVKLVPIPLSIENGFRPPPIEQVEEKITPKTKAILICNPNNPTGTVYSRQELAQIAGLCLRRGIFLISDEVYREFAFEGKSVSVMDFPELANLAILVDSSSKRFNVCGARIGAIASRNPEVISSALKFAMARLSVATIEQLALVPLLNSPEEYFAPIVEEFRKRRDTAYECLKAIPGISFYKPEGAFYIIAGLPVRDSEKFSKWLITEFEDKNETALLAPGQGFYATPGKGTNEVRLAFMLNSNDLKRAIEIIGLGLKAYKD